MDGGALWAAVHGVAKSQTRLSDFTFTFHFHALEKEMATHSSVLAWRIQRMVEPGGLLSMGSHRVRHNWSDLAAAAAAAHPQVNTMERQGRKGGKEENVDVVNKNKQETSQPIHCVFLVRILGSVTSYKRHVRDKTENWNMGSVQDSVRQSLFYF